MGFLAPWFLAGLAAAALPLWLHLLRRHRQEPRPFSSLMFFEPRTQSSVLHRRLRYLLLLALRLVLLCLLALAFANPYFLVSFHSSSSGPVLVLVLDRSFSMRSADHLDQARALARRALSAWPSGGPAEVLALDAAVSVLAGPTTDRSPLNAAIASIQPTDLNTSFGALARALRGIESTQHRPLDVRLFSDFQRTAMPPSFADLTLPPGVRLTASPIAASGPNWTVESVNAPLQIFDAGKKRVTATVAGFNTPASSLPVSLVLDGRVLESKTVAVPANGRATVEFQSLDTPYGFHRGEVRLTASDLLPADNAFPFAVERSEPRPALLLYSGNRSRPALFYRTALEASGASGFSLEARSLDQAAGLDLSPFAFVVLSDPGRISPSLDRSLRSFLRLGRGVLVALGPFALNAGPTPLAGYTVRGEDQPPRGDASQSAVISDSAHPSLRGLALSEVKFYSSIAVDPGPARVLARLADQTPLLLEQSLGSGKILTFASTLDNVANDFPLHPSFVPFVQQTARYLGAAGEGPRDLTAGAVFDLHREGDSGAAIDVSGPDGKRVLSLAEAASAKSVTLDAAGFYEIHAPAGRNSLIAVHPDRRESDLTPVPAETLALWTAAGASSPAPSAPAGGENGHRPRPVGLYLLFLALLAALAESVVSVRYLWKKEGA